jgi:hypothetical protein
MAKNGNNPNVHLLMNGLKCGMLMRWDDIQE